MTQPADNWIRAMWPSVSDGTTVYPPSPTLEFDGATIVRDSQTGVLTVVQGSNGVVPGDTASFGAANPILSKAERAHTTTATVFSGYTYDLPVNGGADLRVVIVGKDRASGGTYRCDLRVMYSRNGSGAPAIQGSLVKTEQALGSLATASATVDVSSNTIRVRITPVNTVDTDWSVAAEVQQVAAV